jgi:16S rRNA (uracil1498-N3)-methyltransferase
VSNGPWFISSLGDASRVVLDRSESHHALRVLRLGANDSITVTDGRGTVARCVVTDTTDGRVIARALEITRHPRRAPELVVYQGAAKGAKLDDVIGGLAQIGAGRVCVYRSGRSVVRWDAGKGRRLADRWAAIARSAAKQSRSPFLMGTGPPIGWRELMAAIAAESHAVVLWEGAEAPLRSALAEPVPRVALVIGPEGGLDTTEAAALGGAGGRIVTLGPRILRTELAPVAAAAAVMYHYGQLG